ncbi:MAG: serine/arginine repetitive matrix protein 2 [Clostridia bacterium]|nr:serine/arginine repetitive matrix protein 2 [Clostridia bacterium]
MHIAEKRVTRHNGRAGKNGVYNPKHNDRSFDLAHADHIDPAAAQHNVLWDCYGGYTYLEKRNTEDLAVRFEEVERHFYAERYTDYCLGQHERNRKTGHPERDRSTEDLRLNKKTCPEESIIQIGNMEDQIPDDAFFKIAVEFFDDFNQRFGEHVHILDWSLHIDEATPHIHERHVFDCENQYGEIAPQQEKALEALEIPLPFPDQPAGKHNNRKMKFDSICRWLLIDVARRHGVEIADEPIYGGREYLEKQDFIREKLKAQIGEHNEKLKSKQTELDELTIKIENAEQFADEVAEVAYEKAVAAVSEKVREETRNEDFVLIESYRNSVLKNPKNTEPVKKIAKNLFTGLLQKFTGATKQIAEKLATAFADPAQKATLKQPIRASVLDKLNRNKQKIADENPRRQNPNYRKEL